MNNEVQLDINVKATKVKFIGDDQIVCKFEIYDKKFYCGLASYNAIVEFKVFEMHECMPSMIPMYKTDIEDFSKEGLFEAIKTFTLYYYSINTDNTEDVVIANV